MSARERERAFPSSAIGDEYGGMSMWDWYAGQAVAGLASRSDNTDHASRRILDIAGRAGEIADAMMVERAKRRQGEV